MKYFDFLCNDCKTIFEKLVKTTEKVECKSCGSTNTTPIPGSAGFQFNGMGFDHRKK